MPIKLNGYELSETQVAGIEKVVTAMLVNAGSIIPPGGVAGQVLIKNSPALNDTSWATLEISESGNIVTQVDGGTAGSVYDGGSNIDGGTA